MGTAMKKVDLIRQIVQLKQMIRRWKALSLRRDGGGYGGLQTPPGFLAVYAGAERVRFVIPTRFVNLPVFAALLQRAEEEYGYPTAGGLALPCEPAFFRFVIDALVRDEPRFRAFSLDDFLALFASASSSAGSAVPCRDSTSYRFSLNLPKTKAR